MDSKIVWLERRQRANITNSPLSSFDSKKPFIGAFILVSEAMSGLSAFASDVYSSQENAFVHIHRPFTLSASIIFLFSLAAITWKVRKVKMPMTTKDLRLIAMDC